MNRHVALFQIPRLVLAALHLCLDPRCVHSVSTRVGQSSLGCVHNRAVGCYRPVLQCSGASAMTTPSGPVGWEGLKANFQRRHIVNSK